MKKQTAVEWFFSELEKMQYFIGNDMLQAYKQAKEMEKQQIMDAYEDGCCYWDCEKSSEQYYNQAFNSEK
jgi:hypothetical protein